MDCIYITRWYTVPTISSYKVVSVQGAKSYVGVDVWIHTFLTSVLNKRARARVCFRVLGCQLLENNLFIYWNVYVHIIFDFIHVPELLKMSLNKQQIEMQLYIVYLWYVVFLVSRFAVFLSLSPVAGDLAIEIWSSNSGSLKNCNWNQIIFSRCCSLGGPTLWNKFSALSPAPSLTNHTMRRSSAVKSVQVLERDQMSSLQK